LLATATMRSRASREKGLFVDRREQERARLLPLAPHRALGRAEELANLCFTVAGEIAHLDDLRERRIDGVECPQCIVYTQERRARVNLSELITDLRVERDDAGITASSLRLLLAREVDRDVAHRLGRIREEVLAIRERQLRRVDQPQIAFVNERGGVQMRDAAVHAKPRPRDRAQLRIERNEDLVERTTLAVRGLGEKLREGCLYVLRAPKDCIALSASVPDNARFVC
jgi:hypothetical protein